MKKIYFVVIILILLILASLLILALGCLDSPTLNVTVVDKFEEFRDSPQPFASAYTMYFIVGDNGHTYLFADSSFIGNKVWNTIQRDNIGIWRKLKIGDNVTIILDIEAEARKRSLEGIGYG
jgi:hypothetical protein